MIPGGSRASQTVLLFSMAALAAAFWLGHRPDDPALEERLEVASRNVGSDGSQISETSEAEVLLARAEALFQRMKEARKPTPDPGIKLIRDPGTPPGRTVSAEPPGVDDLRGRLVGGSIHLEWNPTGASPRSWKIERLAEDDRVETSREIPADTTRFEGEPVTELSGIHTYRVSAMARDGTVAGAQRIQVPFEVIGFRVEFLGPEHGGDGRFLVAWKRNGEVVSGTFSVAPGETIGGVVPETGDRPPICLETGYRFLGYGVERDVETRKTAVPRFAPDGRVLRPAGKEDVVEKEREAPVVSAVLTARIGLPPGDEPEREVELREAKDGTRTERGSK